jgi:glycerate kinase
MSPRPRALACPASFKGVLRAREVAAALAHGLEQGGLDADELPVADGGEGTLDVLERRLGGVWHEARVHDAFGTPRTARWLDLPDGTAAVEAAEAIPYAGPRDDVLEASSRGLGELIAAVGRPRSLLVALGGTATVDGGAGLREVLAELPAPTRVACDVDAPLLDAAYVFARQKSASDQAVPVLAARLAAMGELAPVASRPGAGAAGGLGAALAALGAELVPGARLVLDLLGFDAERYSLVVTGEGTLDATTMRGKAPGEVVRRCAAAGVPCVVVAGRVEAELPGAVVFSLSGDPARARDDVVAAGKALAARAA